jgi:hypothetical protein
MVLVWPWGSQCGTFLSVTMTSGVSSVQIRVEFFGVCRGWSLG